MAKLTKSQKLNNLNKLNTIIDRTEKHMIWETKVLDEWFKGIADKLEALDLDAKLVNEAAKLQKDIHSKLDASVKALKKVYAEWDANVDAEEATDDEE